jgi:hypothetical protein
MFQEMNNWLSDRCGKFTSSEVHKLIGKGRAKADTFSQTGKSYIKQKVAEFITKEPIQRPTTYAMEWGLSNETEALNVFENLYGPIERFGGGNPVFFKYTPYFGGSPDGIFKDSVLEVKCPFNQDNHLDHLLLNTAEDLKEYAPEYYWQMVSNMIILKKRKAIFISYDPRFPLEFNLKVLKFDLNQEDADFLEERIRLAEELFKDTLKQIYEPSQAVKENSDGI